MASNNTCAPGVAFRGNSCISTDILEDMIKKYNETHSDKLIIDKTISSKSTYDPIAHKKHLVELLESKLGKQQTEWGDKPFFKKLSDARKTIKLHKLTFKPSGPRDSDEWLNTYNINDIFAQYEQVYPDFKFMGAHPRDFDDIPSAKIRNINYEKLFESGIRRLGFVFNLDRSNQSGSHWVSMYADLAKGQIYFMDSVGERPAKEFRDLMERIKSFYETNERKKFCDSNPSTNVCQVFKDKSVDMRYNKTQHQFEDTECGVYSISFILRLLDGETFDDITNTVTLDREMRKCRRLYFR